MEKKKNREKFNDTHNNGYKKNEDIENNDIEQKEQPQESINILNNDMPNLNNIDEEIDQIVVMNELLNMNVLYGHKKELTSKYMRENFIYCSSEGLSIFNLEKTCIYLKKALKKAYDIIMEGKSILIVCTKKSSAAQLVKDMAEGCGQNYITKRWIPGSLTNKDTIKKSVEKVKFLEISLANSKAPNRIKRKIATDLHAKKTKLEGMLECNIDNIGGVFCIYCENLPILIHECKQANIPLIAVCDSNIKEKNLKMVDYIIPGNDDALKAIGIYSYLLSQVIRRAYQNTLEKIKKNRNITDKNKNLINEEDLKNAVQRKFASEASGN